MLKKFGLGIVVCAIATAQVQTIEGIWQGAIDVNGIRLRLAFHISKNDQGALVTRWDSLDQGARDMASRTTTFEAGKLHIQINGVTKFEGTLSADGQEMDGTFTQGSALPLKLKRVAKIEELVRPQNPKPPFPYKSDDVTYPNKAAGITLAATLTIPPGDGPFPAALMITGSGPQDRDSTLLGHKPFWVIADYLSRRGIAVLRVDDRGMGKSTGVSSQMTLDEMADDVLVGVDYLKSRKEIDPRRIGVIGHSEGGIVGPYAASKSADIAFVVMLGGTAVSGEQVLYLQGSAVMKSDGANQAAIDANLKLQKTTFDVLRQLKDEKNQQVLMTKLRDAFFKLLDQTSPGLTEAQHNAAFNSMRGEFLKIIAPEMRSFLFFDPAEALKKVKVPLLALNGSSDVQVIPAQNLPVIAASMIAAGNPDFEIAELPGLNHLFQKCKTCSPSEYGDLEQTFSPDALDILGNWLARHTRKTP